ncbi:unnamed protein product, partial [Medioppia subpectinata]
EELIQREDNTRHETQDNREKTSAEEVVDSEDNESNDGIDCQISNESNDETVVGSDGEDIEDNNGFNTDLNEKTNGEEKETRDKTRSESKSDIKQSLAKKWSKTKPKPKSLKNKRIIETKNRSTDRKTGLKSDTDRKPKKVYRNTQYKRNYICHHKDCRKAYISLIVLKKHYQSSKHLDHRWFCESEGCSQHFPSKSKLEEHTNDGEHTSRQPFTCWHYGCDFEAITRDVFDIHTDTHSSEQLIQALKQSVEPQYVCEHNGCGKRFADRTALNGHMTTHSGVRFHCEEANCLATFAFPSSLRKHTQRVHRSDYQCPQKGCNFSAGSKCELSSHVKSRHTEARKQFQCSATGCPKRFTERKALNAHHMRAHPDAAATVPWLECLHEDCEFKTKYAPDMAGHEAVCHTMSNTCTDCGNSFANKCIFQRHLKTHNWELKTPCEWPVCDRRFQSAGAMRLHMEAQHSDSGPAYRCQWPGCDKTYSLSLSLHMHERRVHKGVAEHRCHWPGCDYKTTNRVRLHSHINGHKGLKAYQCSHPGCDYESKRGHQILHFKERLKCPQTGCPYTAVTRAALFQHRKTHPKPYACDSCGLKCRSNTLLRTHKRRHNDALKFRCEWPECGRLFAMKSVLRDHMNTHTATVKHTCQWPGCGHTYTNINSLQMHVHRVHKGQHEGLDDYQCSHTGCDYKTSKCGQMDAHMKTHTKS